MTTLHIILHFPFNLFLTFNAMGHYADIYVIKKTRSKQLGLDFLDHFLPKRKESADAYDVPQYGDSTQVIFSKAKEVMSYMEQHLDVYQSIY